MRFVPGYLFGRKAIERELEWSAKAIEQSIAAEKSKASLPWRVWHTGLDQYANTFGLDTRAFLTRKLAEAKNTGRKLRVLDVGVGEGRQWIEFLRENQDDIEFHATGLTTHRVHYFLASKTVACTAAELHEKFPAGYFDVILSNQGTHNQEKSGLENIVYLLAKGGEALVSGTYHALARPLPPLKELAHHAHYEIIKEHDLHDVVKRMLLWSYHVRKK